MGPTGLWSEKEWGIELYWVAQHASYKPASDHLWHSFINSISSLPLSDQSTEVQMNKELIVHSGGVWELWEKQLGNAILNIWQKLEKSLAN